MNRYFSWISQPIRSLFRFEPTEHAWWEHIFFRIGLAWLIYDSVPFMRLQGCPEYTSLPVPSSIGIIWDGITALGDTNVFRVVRQLFWIALGLYVCGVATPIALTYMFVVDMCLGSLFASQGAHGHSRQVLGLVMLGLALASWVVPFLKSRGGWRNFLLWTTSAQNVVVSWGRQMLAAAYAASAVTKEINSDGFWFMRYDSFILAVIKAQEEAVIKGTEMTQGAMDFAQWMAGQPFLSSIMLFSAFFVELFTPLILLNRRMALIWGCLLVIFHLINGWFMGLPFQLNRGIIIVLFINIPFWIIWGFKKLLGNNPQPAAAV